MHREIQTTGPFDQCIEIIDIECVLLSFLSQKFVATKWPIYRGILARSNLLWQGISRGCGPMRGVRLFFSNTVFLKSLKMRLNWKIGFGRKIYSKIQCQGCCERQNKTQRLRQNPKQDCKVCFQFYDVLKSSVSW